MSTFQMTRSAFPGYLWDLLWCFSAVEFLKSCRKASLEVSGQSLCRVFETHLAYQCVSVIQALPSLLFLEYMLLLQLNGLLTSAVRKDKQIYIRTCIHTNTHIFENNFKKPGCGNTHSLIFSWLKWYAVFS